MRRGDPKATTSANKTTAEKRMAQLGGSTSSLDNRRPTGGSGTTPNARATDNRRQHAGGSSNSSHGGRQTSLSVRWPLHRITLVLAGMAVVFVLAAVVFSPALKGRRSGLLGGDGLAVDEGVRTCTPSSTTKAAPTEKGSTSADQTADDDGNEPTNPNVNQKKRGFTTAPTGAKGAAGGTTRRAAGSSAPEAPLKPVPITHYRNFITPTDAFLATVRRMSGTEAATVGSEASSSPSNVPRKSRRVDSCGAPFIAPFMTANTTNSGSSSSPPHNIPHDPYDRQAIKAYLHDEVEALLGCGTRIGGSDSDGYKCAMQYLRARMRCDNAGRSSSSTPPSSGDAADEGASSSAVQLSSRQWWHATIDSYDKVRTVVGDRYFNNFAGEFTAGDEQRYGHLVLAAHWDSKDIPADPKTGKVFVAATDSAVPIVILLEMMKYVSAYAEMLRAANGGSDEGLYIPLPRITVLLFDGEEAFIEWRDNDNTYGSRLQAARWKREGRLRTITTFMLLDLIGAPDSQMHNLYHGQTGKQYSALRNIEMAFYDESLRVAKELSEAVGGSPSSGEDSSGDAAATPLYRVAGPQWRHWPNNVLGKDSVAFTGYIHGQNQSAAQSKTMMTRRMTRDSYFPREPLGIRSHVSDDHEPWLREGAPILHLISLPFPKVWHTLGDDNEHVHYDTVYEYLRVFSEYVLSYTKAGADPQRG